jgi:type II secretory pathway pseudopilin PulG
MKAPLKNSSCRGVSVFELLIVALMVAVVLGFALVNFVQGQRAIMRTTTATELATVLQKARLDSMRRSAKDVAGMAQVKILNNRIYSIAVDADNDGNLDVPQVMTLPEEKGVDIGGPFPKNFIFDWLGQTVDEQNRRTNMQPVMIKNSSGASVIAISETGKPVVVGPTNQ